MAPKSKNLSICFARPPAEAFDSSARQASDQSEALRSRDSQDLSVHALTVDYRPTHIDAKDALDFASLKMKAYYDVHHQPMFFNVGDLVKLRWHRGYGLPDGLQPLRARI